MHYIWRHCVSPDTNKKKEYYESSELLKRFTAYVFSTKNIIYELRNTIQVIHLENFLSRKNQLLIGKSPNFTSQNQLKRNR